MLQELEEQMRASGEGAAEARVMGLGLEESDEGEESGEGQEDEEGKRRPAAKEAARRKRPHAGAAGGGARRMVGVDGSCKRTRHAAAAAAAADADVEAAGGPEGQSSAGAGTEPAMLRGQVRAARAHTPISLRGAPLPTAPAGMVSGATVADAAMPGVAVAGVSGKRSWTATRAASATPKTASVDPFAVETDWATVATTPSAASRDSTSGAHTGHAASSAVRVATNFSGAPLPPMNEQAEEPLVSHAPVVAPNTTVASDADVLAPPTKRRRPAAAAAAEWDGDEGLLEGASLLLPSAAQSVLLEEAFPDTGLAADFAAEKARKPVSPTQLPWARARWARLALPTPLMPHLDSTSRWCPSSPQVALADAEAPPVEEEGAMPGWGSWGGLGAKASGNCSPTFPVLLSAATCSRAPSRFQPNRREPAKRSAAEVRAELLAAAAARRKDAALRHVIVSEKRDKKAAAFTTSGVPFPFKTRQQFERSVRAPLGLEWNPTASHAALTRPKVHTTRGVVIDPLADHLKRPRGGEPGRKAKTKK